QPFDVGTFKRRQTNWTGKNRGYEATRGDRISSAGAWRDRPDLRLFKTRGPKPGASSREVNVRVLSLLATFLLSAPAVAQAYPDRPMTVTGTTPAGISVDLITRYFGERVKTATGQPWVVVNRPGAQGSIAAKATASAKPDGYTMFICPSGALSANQYLQ